MIRLRRAAVPVIVGIYAVWLSPVVRADEAITYEVLSDDIPTANIEYFDGTARQELHDAALPWRTTVKVADPRSLGFDGALVIADWRPGHVPIGPLGAPSLAGKFVTVRILIENTVRCSNTLDVGDAACYGASAFDNS